MDKILDEVMELVMKEQKDNTKPLKSTKDSKELIAIAKALAKYIDKYKGNCVFTCSLTAFEGEECQVVEDRIFCWGDREVVLLELEDTLKQIQRNTVEDEWIEW